MITASVFYVAILKNLQIRVYYHDFPKIHVSALYYIKCSFARYSSTRQNIFYNYQVLDSNKKVLTNNLMNFDSIICQIPKEDYWGNPISSHNYVVFQVSITDHNSIKKTLLFDNKSHSIDPFKNLFIYIKELKNKNHDKIKIGSFDIISKTDFIKYCL